VAEHAAAVLVAMLPGMEGGRAIADILFGDVNPSGKLPFTYPRSPNDIVMYDYKPLEVADVNKYNPLWPFGYGLSYTTFGYRDLTLDKPSYRMDQHIQVSVKVRNTGKHAGKEVVQLFVCDMYGSVSRPDRQLKGFSKILLQPGEEQQVDFILDQRHLSFIGRDNRRVVEPGMFKVMIDTLATKFVLVDGGLLGSR